MFVVVETFLNPGEPSDAQYRVRPVEGQIFPTSMRVQCSRAMRQAFRLGSQFRLPVELVENKTGGRFLRELGKEPWVRLNPTEVSQLLNSRQTQTPNNKVLDVGNRNLTEKILCVENNNLTTCPVCNCNIRKDNINKHLISTHLLDRKDFLIDAIECFERSANEICECKFCLKSIKKTRLAGHFRKVHGDLFRESINAVCQASSTPMQNKSSVQQTRIERCDCGTKIYYVLDKHGVMRAHNVGSQKIFSELHVCDGLQKSESIYAFNGGIIDSNRRKH